MTLADFIAQIGDDAAAALFGVESRTAASWRRGERNPRPQTADRIVELLKGRVTYEGIYRRNNNRPVRRRRAPATPEGSQNG